MNFSYWEVDFRLKNVDFLIVGAGIVGLSSAFHIKKRFPDAKVLVVERDFISAGASSKNAGFACFGSPSEILDDVENNGWESAMSTVRFRMEGLELLKQYVPFAQMDGFLNDGYEIFQKEDSVLLENVKDRWSELERSCLDYIGQMPFLFSKDQWGLKHLEAVIRIKGEGILHPAKMLGAWQELCRKVGVDIIYGLNIDNLDVQTGIVQIRQHEFSPKKVVLCTNGLTNSLFKGLDVIPARNQVLITHEILKEPWNCSFHQRQGYIYFRSVGKRILIGGGRDLFKEMEYTDSLDINEEVIQYLRRHLEGLIGIDDFQIEHRWSGIMGLGNTKGPIIQKVSDHVFAAVRMGGMGVAIGTAVGKQLAAIME